MTFGPVREIQGRRFCLVWRDDDGKILPFTMDDTMRLREQVKEELERERKGDQQLRKMQRWIRR